MYSFIMMFATESRLTKTWNEGIELRHNPSIINTKIIN